MPHPTIQPHWLAVLEQGLARAELSLPTETKQLLLGYTGLLNKWNKAYNLTAVRDPLEMLSRHLLDSLSLREFLQGELLLDVGSGGGLPGLPLAIVEPQRHFTLLDSNGKKTRFLQQVVLELKLPNVTVVQSRIEAYTPPSEFSCITARAVAEPVEIFALVKSKLVVAGHLLVMAGPNQHWPTALAASASDEDWQFSRLVFNTLDASAERAVCIAARLR